MRCCRRAQRAGAADRDRPSPAAHACWRLLVGAALGLSGAVLQGLTRNPLAEPGLLGVSTGAALGAVLAIYFGVTALVGVAGPLLGMVGALAACALTFALGAAAAPSR